MTLDDIVVDAYLTLFDLPYTVTEVLGEEIEMETLAGHKIRISRETAQSMIDDGDMQVREL